MDCRSSTTSIEDDYYVVDAENDTLANSLLPSIYDKKKAGHHRKVNPSSSLVGKHAHNK